MEFKYDPDTLELRSDGAEKLVVIEDPSEIFTIANTKGLRKHPHVMTIVFAEIEYQVRYTSSNGDISPMYVVVQHFTKLNLEQLHDLFRNEGITIIYEYLGNKPTEHIKLYKYLLNMSHHQYGTSLKGELLQEEMKLSSRGIAGERPRELRTKFGFEFLSHNTNKTLKQGFYMITSPFPYLKRSATSASSATSACFTCGIAEGNLTYQGHLLVFEHGHLQPESQGGTETQLQCVPCNKKSKDYIVWASDGRIKSIDVYAVMRDAPELKVLEAIDKLRYLKSIVKRFRSQIEQILAEER